MTREEAIELIDDRMCFGRGKWSKHHEPEIDEYWQAGQMAIEALRNKNDLPISPLLKEPKQPENESEQFGNTEKLDDRTTDDCISRADVEQTVEDNILCYTHSDRPIDQDADTECHMAIRVALKMLRKDLRKLPSAQPERKIGRWIYGEDNLRTGVDGWFCSECEHFEAWDYSADMKSAELNLPNFCPNCGADMRGEEK